MPSWVWLGVSLISLWVVACQGGERPDIEPVEIPEEPRLSIQVTDNWKIRRVLGLESLMCIHPVPSGRHLYFDEPFWQNISREQKTYLNECLDLKRQIKVGTVAPNARGVKTWTARIDDRETYLFIGWLMNDCIVCDLQSGVVEYKLTRQGDTLLVPTLVKEEELWR